MFRLIVSIVCAAFSAVSAAEDIESVLQRSHDQRLSALTAAGGSPKTDAIEASFKAVVEIARPKNAPSLKIVQGAVAPNTSGGRIIVVSESLSELGENERRFVLAHEIGHVEANHWAQLIAVYKKWIPGEVLPATTDPVAKPLGREASVLVHGHEFEADAHAARVMGQLGMTADEMVAVVMKSMTIGDTATHPSARKRVGALRQLLSSEGSVPVASTQLADGERQVVGKNEASPANR